MTDTILNVSGVSKRFGGLQALSDVGIRIERGQVYGLIGPNGAGKTTFFNVLTGLYTPDSGSFELAGQAYQPTAVHTVAMAGIARTFQNIRLFAEMTALENVMVGNKTYAAHPWSAFWGFGQRRKAVDEAMHWLETMHLSHQADVSAQSLSYGEARRLEIARALAGYPALLLLDEPAAGMNEGETEALIQDIQTARSQVKAMLLIEHDMGLIRSLSDRVVAMDYGRKIAEGSATSVLAHPEVKKAYLGEDE